DDGSKLVIEWKDAVHFSGAGPCTFEVFLWPSGQIEYQYLALGSLTSAGTIGIQDETGGVGLLVAYNVPYAHPALPVRLSHQDDWLTLDRASGSLAPAGSDTLRLRFDSRQYRDGDYAGEVRIASNDVTEPLLVVPCAMHVGLLVDPAEAHPDGFDAVSVTPLVRFVLSPPPGGSLVPSSLRLNRVGVTPAQEPTRTRDGKLEVALKAVDVLVLAGPGRGAADTLTGEYDGGGWFAAEAALAVGPPGMLGGPLAPFGSTLRPTPL